uniref:WD_REPEATS_REGION domain-containing protein n=1 Tax=Syphacia muris TaxID=451379 RepID=A0A0N5AGS0_9BILA
MPFTIPGSLHPSNKNAISWNEKGLIAYGCHCTLIIVDTLRKRIVQTLEKHITAIHYVCWAPQEDISASVEGYTERCASVDVSGQIIVWNVLDGTDVSSFRYQNSALKTICWFAWEERNTQFDFLLALHTPGILILWNTSTGEQVWNVNFESQLEILALDPYDSRNLAFGGRNGIIYLVNEVFLHKAPSTNMCAIAAFDNNSDVLQLQFHTAFENLLFAASSSEIVCLETVCRCILWRHTIECPLITMLCCTEIDAFFAVHTNGLVVLRKCSIIPGSDRWNSGFSYEKVMTAETQRQSSHHRIFAVAMCPITQATMAFLYNSGRIAFYQLVFDDGDILKRYRTQFVTDFIGVDDKLQSFPLGPLRLSNNGEMFSLGQSALTVCMRPIDALEGENELHLAAIGNNRGIIHLVDVLNSAVYKELHVHGCPIKCLEWANAHSLISAACTQSLTTSPVVRNDIFITDILTGESKRLRPEIDETPVEMLRVSYYHCYVAIGFRSEPLEIWHLKTMRLLRRMSRACPVIVDMAWSSKHNTMKTVNSGKEVVFRENLVVLDQDCHLYHVVVKGLHVRDGKEVSSQWKSGAASMKCLVWKDDLLATGDTSGRIGIWDLEKRQCRQVGGSFRGSILKMTFSRLNGDHTLAVLHAHIVVLWDADQLTVLQQYSLGNSLSFVDLDLCGLSPILLCSDNSFRYMPVVTPNEPIYQKNIPLLLSSEVICCTADGKTENEELKPLEVLLDCIFSDQKKMLMGDGKVSDLTHHASNLTEQFDNATHDANKELDEATSTAGVSLIKYRALHRLLGNKWLYTFWSIVESLFRSTRLPSNLHLFWPKEMLNLRSEQLLSYMMNIPDLNSEQIKILVHRAVILKKCDWAIQLLLGDESRSSALKACLLASDVSSESAQSIIKLVATNLIASSCVIDGVEMLFLIDHIEDACRYLQAQGLWKESYIFAKMTMNEYSEIAQKWIDYFISTNTRKSLCCLLALSQSDWDRVLKILAATSQGRLAKQLEVVLQQQSISIAKATEELVDLKIK